MRQIDNLILKYIPFDGKCRINESQNIYLRQKEKEDIMSNATSGMDMKVNIDWIKCDPDMSVCRRCKEVIYGSQYLLQITLNETLIEQKRPVNLCEPCYNLVK